MNDAMHRPADRKALVVARGHLHRLELRYETQLLRRSILEAPLVRRFSAAAALVDALRAFVATR